MTGKAATMTPTQIKAAGYAVVKSADIGNPQHAKCPWFIMRLGSGDRVLFRYGTYAEAVEALHVELSNPDGVLR